MNKLISGLALLPLITGASQAESVSEALLKCSQETNSLQRLVCYDRLVKDMRQFSGLEASVSQVLPAAVSPAPVATPQRPAAPAVVAPAVAQSAQRATQQTEASAPAVRSAEDEFGMEQRSEKQQSIDKFYASVVSVKKDNRKRQVISLENGHVWRQAESSALKVREGETIYVERGALGSFYMSKDDVNRRMRVKRDK